MSTRRIATCVYGAVALAILLPLLGPGYVLTLDMIFTPHVRYPLNLDNLWPFHAVMNTLGLMVPSQVLEKLMLLGIFAGAGLGMHRLVPAESQWARYAAGVLYVINPFTYARLMAGQYLVLAGYALMPWFLAALMRFVRKPGRGSAWPLTAWALAIGFVSLHYLGFALLAGLLALGIWSFRERRRPRELKRLTLWSGGVGLAVLLINSFWLIPLLLHRTPQAGLIGSFGDAYFLSFRTISDHIFGQMLNTLALYGFWGDDQGQYLLPKVVIGWWWLLALTILVVAGVGAVKKWRRDRFGIALTLALLVVGLVLTQGIMGSPFAPLNHWLETHVLAYRGYREPGKFVGLIALAVAYCFGLGADWLLSRTKADWLPGLFVALPLVYTPTMLWGAAGQLHAVNYPADWYALNRHLDAEHSSAKVLFLPWREYMRFGFAGRIIANPAPRFFDRPTIAGTNAQIGLIENQSADPQSQFIERQILATSHTNIAAKLKARGFEYIELAKEADYQNYAWLASQPGLTLVSDTATLRVYRIT